LHERLEALLATADDAAVDAGELGRVAQQLFVLRARSHATQYRLARGEKLGPETSIDKLMVATAEQDVFDLAAEALGAAVAFGDDVASRRWRSEFLFSRAASIYGGSVEIQRNILARRVLQLGPDLGAER
jgi:alkylation response protein AidB-like acyl-CoA dehydrogenase